MSFINCKNLSTYSLLDALGICLIKFFVFISNGLLCKFLRIKTIKYDNFKLIKNKNQIKFIKYKYLSK